MSQDNQNSQPPASPEPKRNRSRQERYQRQQPIWKTTIIRILRGTIGVLETAVVKLETAPPPGTEETPGFWQQLQSLWSGLLAKIRSLLPVNLSRQLSDTALTGIIAGIAVILVWTTSSIFTNKPTEIATVPPVEEVPVPTPTVTTPPESTAPEPETEATPTPTPEAEVTPTPEPEPEVTPTPEAEPTPTPTPEPTPTPAVELTPEQILIASIENQVAEISDRIASGLIQSIQANFRTSNLTVKISNDWYTLKESQQDKLADEILQRSQELDFTHLEIVDAQDKLIARNPVVGNQIIIFKRRALNQAISSQG
ncbi:hypothetical protein H6G76_10230 [Nostoc sp. FACHB-152]|uniref:hypothetical protein n=1 Tax=unclassified Nostoc TaxID=2593658 RepID=UPI001686F563|nr:MULTISPECIES: hypothetical protein [unclassified Nostoc]MBD2447541.1 hypothetical protein [Nostoc sp. FACHB-152]MBD2469311.1 hypothetical protein [Nostoc sp. FACHB-145]